MYWYLKAKFILKMPELVIIVNILGAIRLTDIDIA